MNLQNASNRRNNVDFHTIVCDNFDKMSVLIVDNDITSVVFDNITIVRYIESAICLVVSARWPVSVGS